MKATDMQAIARILAYQATQDRDKAEALLDWAYKTEGILLDQEPIAPRKPNYDEAANRIYALYPSTDSLNGNRNLAKGSKCKEQIKRILAKGQETEESLTRKINKYIVDSRANHSWLTNFGTFLNNLPDDDGDGIFAQPSDEGKSIYQ